MNTADTEREDLARFLKRLESGERYLNTGEDFIPPWTDEACQKFIEVMQRIKADLDCCADATYRKNQ